MIHRRGNEATGGENRRDKGAAGENGAARKQGKGLFAKSKAAEDAAAGGSDSDGDAGTGSFGPRGGVATGGRDKRRKPLPGRLRKKLAKAKQAVTVL